MNTTAAARSRARKFLVQALYQGLLTGDEPGSVVHGFIADHNMKRADVDYFRDVLLGIGKNGETLRTLVSGKLDRAFEELDPIEESILLLGAYELQSRLDVPYRVVINEGVELAKIFGATDSFKYVNSILDGLARDLRTTER